ncbi:hypothetical protein [Streptomyces sp. NPDC017941]|uniref:hypothetical protein n=1 Tax=Streptomyces sp. NPDC017941 TaxID=3365018 RepID=UPI003795AD93
MQRSTITAVVLVPTAVLALSGCTEVERPAGQSATTTGTGASAGPAATADAPPSRAPRAVQAPAHDTLQRMGPAVPPRSAPPLATSTPRRPPTPAPPPGPPAAGPKPTTGHDRPAHREPPRQPAYGGGNGAPPRTSTAAPPHPWPTRPDVDLCALGRVHAGWKPDSPEAVICREAYGR